MTTVFVLLIQCAILAYAVVVGVFLAFSDFIVRALGMASGHGNVFGHHPRLLVADFVPRWTFWNSVRTLGCEITVPFQTIPGR